MASWSGFLCDEHVHPSLARAIGTVLPDAAVWIVGRDPAPARSTSDPDLLAWTEEHRCLLLSNDRRSLPGHLRAHLASGRSCPGILVLRRTVVSWGRLLQDLTFLWSVAEADDLRDRLTYLPL